jgi:hypothetical protein
MGSYGRYEGAYDRPVKAFGDFTRAQALNEKLKVLRIGKLWSMVYDLDPNCPEPNSGDSFSMAEPSNYWVEEIEYEA